MTEDSKLFYYGTNIEVCLRDRVEVRKWFFWWREGFVCYMPGISPPHPQLVGPDGTPYWSVDIGDGTIFSWIYLPDRIQPGRNIRFICRGNPETKTLDPSQPLT